MAATWFSVTQAKAYHLLHILMYFMMVCVCSISGSEIQGEEIPSSDQIRFDTKLCYEKSQRGAIYYLLTTSIINCQTQSDRKFFSLSNNTDI